MDNLLRKEMQEEKRGAVALRELITKDHKTEKLNEAKVGAKQRGRAGRFRGKAKARQNNKARGGKMAR